MIKPIIYSLLLSLGALLAGCSGASRQSTEQTITVSIPPLKYFVDRITGSRIPVTVLVPETTSPETYEPTIAQIKSLSRSDIYISIGLIDFENSIEQRLASIAPQLTLVKLSDGLPLLEGNCGHTHHHGHSHAVDPHIWLSPTLMRTSLDKITQTLCRQYPDSCESYRSRAGELRQEIDRLDRYIRETLPIGSFVIGHPSLTYFAHEYGLSQIAVEEDGKEPGARALKSLADSIRRAGISTILYQKQTTDAAARTLAAEIGGRAVEFDPLAPNWLENMYSITDTLQEILSADDGTAANR